MNPADLEGLFDKDDLCRISLDSGDVEVSTEYMRFTPSALILRGVWHAIALEGDTEDTSPVIGARAIPWREVRSIDSGRGPGSYDKNDLTHYMEAYGVHPDERPLYLTEAQ